MENQDALGGQVALVTGASRGIGRAIATRLGRMGARVSICARNLRLLEVVAAELRGQGIEVTATAADISRSEDVTNLVRHTNDAFGQIDILVNNAGIGEFGPVQDRSEEAWDRVLNTNLKGTFLCTKAVAPQMIRRRSGHIINIASLAGKNAFAGGSVYCASKWGLLGFTYCAAEDLRAHNIRVSVICPGSVQTEFSHSPHIGKEESKMLQPDDVARIVALLVTQAPQSFISEVLIRPTQKP